MTAGDTGPAAPAPAAPAGRQVHFRDFLGLVRRNSPGVFLASALVGLGIVLAAYRGCTPIIQYEAETAIVSVTLEGQLETVWNLPAKTVAIPTVVDDAPDTDTFDLGHGALLLPEGTRLTLIRMANAPLRIRVDSHPKDAKPSLVDASDATPVALKQGSVITLASEPGDPEVSCTHRLMPLALRGVGSLDIGASLASDSRDTPEELAGLTDAEFLARNAQPLLDGGRVFVRGRTLVRTTFDADELILQAGDQLRVPSSAAGGAGVFILQVRTCAPIAVRGHVQSRKVELLRLGSDTSFARVSFWQAISRDPVLTFLAGLLGAFLATYWGFVNERAEKE